MTKTTDVPIAWLWDNNGVTEYTQDVDSVEYYSKTYGVTMTPLYSIDKGQWDNWSNAVAEKLCIAIDRLKDSDNKITELTAKLDKAREGVRQMTTILPCPMCGSPAELESSGAIECYGKAWQTVLIGCNQEKDKHCGMSLSLEADLYNIRNSEQQLVTCWNGLERI